jgi:hypothetical protein
MHHSPSQSSHTFSIAWNWSSGCKPEGREGETLCKQYHQGRSDVIRLVRWYLLVVGLAIPGYTQTVTSKKSSTDKKETTVTQRATAEVDSDPYNATVEIRAFHVAVPEDQLVELRGRVAATRWPGKETVSDATRSELPSNCCGESAGLPFSGAFYGIPTLGNIGCEIR